MANQEPDPKPPTDDTFVLLRRHPLAALSIGLLLMAIVVTFAYVGGFVGPRRLTSGKMADAFEANGGGRHEGVRRAHAKGICISGSFVGTEAARRLSRAQVFDGRTVPVSGRFAEATPDPHANDADINVRSMALRLAPDGAPEWRTAMNDTSGLNVSTPEAFYELNVASTPDPRTGKPDPAKMAAFYAAHPEAAAYDARQKLKPFASGFANDSFNSLDGFIFVGPDGTRRLVRWAMEAEDLFVAATSVKRPPGDRNFAFRDILDRVGRGPIRWRLVATLARPGDPNRAAEVWPADRPRVVLGTLTLDRVEAEGPGNCRDLNFDPMILPPGIEPSDDPIPFARSAVYSTSFRRRAREHKSPSVMSGASAGAMR